MARQARIVAPGVAYHVTRQNFGDTKLNSEDGRELSIMSPKFRSARRVYDGNKAVLAAVEHLPYGEFHTTAGAMPVNTFTGKP